MHYLWRLPVRLRNDKLVDFFRCGPHTPFDSAVLQTLQGLGCLPAGASNHRGARGVTRREVHRTDVIVTKS